MHGAKNMVKSKEWCGDGMHRMLLYWRRYTVEWLSWQFQQFIMLTNGIPVLVSHAEDLDHNEVNEFQRILDFLDIDELHAAEETVTAKVFRCHRGG